jgi:casein kinase II subunit beta
LPGHEYFCDVAEDFIEDDFNLTGLSGLVPFYKEAMEMVLDVEPGTLHCLDYPSSRKLQRLTRAAPPHTAEEDEAHRVPDVSIVESSAELLYGLIHQRYIITRQGLQQMVRSIPVLVAVSFRP